MYIYIQYTPHQMGSQPSWAHKWYIDFLLFQIQFNKLLLAGSSLKDQAHSKLLCNGKDGEATRERLLPSYRAAASISSFLFFIFKLKYLCKYRVSPYSPKLASDSWSSASDCRVLCLFVYGYECLLHVWLWATCVPAAHGSHRLLYPLELELDSFKLQCGF